MQVSQRQTLRESSEQEIIKHFVGHANAYRRQVVVNYYVALKAKPFVILAGPRDVGKASLARGLAESVVGQPGVQWCPLQAHAWWTTHTGHPGHFAIAHARFSYLKLLDLLDLASQAEAEELAFFVGVKRMSPAEVTCYFQDLPRGLLWRADASTAQIHLPQNLYITGTLDVEEGKGYVLDQEVYRHATVIRVNHSHLTHSPRSHKMPPQRPDWQQRFIRSAIRDVEQARAKLAQMLPAGCLPLAPLSELDRRLGGAHLPSFVSEGAWLYLANAFGDDGRGLFAEPAVENLHIAQDYVLAQSVLPCVNGQWAETQEVWDEVCEYLAPRYPRAYAWIARFSGRGPSGETAFGPTPISAKPETEPSLVAGQ